MTMLPLIYALFTGALKAKHSEDVQGPCKD